MIVDDIEQHTHPLVMCAVDEPAEVIGRTVIVGGCEQADSVVAPIKAAWKFGDWHDLEHRNTGGCQFGQLTARRFPGALARERADMHLVNNLPTQSTSAPI